MKIGLMARADSRGIGYQTLNLYRHLHPYRTLVMLLHDRLWPEDISRFDGTNVDHVDVDPGLRLLDERKARKLARGTDCVFAVESLMDWRMIDWAREEGSATVVQANPEFLIHKVDPSLPHPDRWVYPTPWLLEDLPQGEVLPVPVPDSAPFLAPEPTGEPIKVLHVAGHAAAGDRNGTVEFMDCLRYLKRPARVTVYGQDGWLPRVPNLPGYVELILNPNGVKDNWDLYRDQQLIVLPRKYGGLCLPAQEAARCGLAVMMPDCSPNEIYPGHRIPTRKGRLHHAPGGRIPTFNVDARYLATAIDERAHDQQLLHFEMWQSQQWAHKNSWSNLLPLYRQILS